MITRKFKRMSDARLQHHEMSKRFTTSEIYEQEGLYCFDMCGTGTFYYTTKARANEQANKWLQEPGVNVSIVNPATKGRWKFTVTILILPHRMTFLFESMVSTLQMMKIQSTADKRSVIETIILLMDMIK